MLIERNLNKNSIIQCQHNLYAFWKSMAMASSQHIIENDNLLFAPLDSDIAIYNPLFRCSLRDTNPHAVTQQLLKDFGKELSISWWCDSTIHDEKSLAILKKYYSSHIGPVPIMQYDLKKPLNTQNKYSVEIWHNTENLDEFLDPVFICFHMTGADAKIYQRALEINHEKFKHFYVRQENKIVAVASLFFAEETVGCYNLAVLPDYQKHGIATALHIARLHFAKDMNYRTVTLQATPMAIDLDLSIGYKTLSELNIFW